MSKKKSCIVVLIIFSNFMCAIAQYHDLNWLLGYSSRSRNTNPIHLKFNKDGLSKISQFPSNAPKINTYSCMMSDSSGNVLFYTNGLHIYNMNHEIMDGGDTINPGYWWMHCDTTWNAYFSRYQAQAIPYPGKPDNYIMFHPAMIKNTLNLGPLYYTVIDMSHGLNAGSVHSKNNILLRDGMEYFGLVKHANGRDYWLIVPVKATNHFKKYLIDRRGIKNKGIDSTGPIFDNLSSITGVNRVSPNGEYLVVSHPINGIRIYEFDRCSGAITFLDAIQYTNWSRQVNYDLGISISPDSKILYSHDGFVLHQYDLTAQSIEDTRLTIARFDRYQDNYFTIFSWCKLAVDGKIYMASGSNNAVLHVIERPNLRGLACNFRQHSISLPEQNFNTIPVFPNYRLGPVKGSPCDSLNVTNSNDR
ncbi:MAG: hypothetical protein R3275_06245 [Saprospiraceae bacterium]|nr:hypothetical protein [Saprospiraceae bacterium]